MRPLHHHPRSCRAGKTRPVHLQGRGFQAALQSRPARFRQRRERLRTCSRIRITAVGRDKKFRARREHGAKPNQQGSELCLHGEFHLRKGNWYFMGAHLMRAPRGERGGNAEIGKAES